MTNTLHRFGAPETFQDDFVVFAMAARGINDKDAHLKLIEFLRMAVKHHAVNVGNALKGGMYKASENLSPLVHWHRSSSVDPEDVIKNIDENTTLVEVVFDTPENLEAFLVDVRKADLGISVNISSLTDQAHTCCKNVGITRHSVGYSLGFHGDLNLLPDCQVLELSTMCGHGMVSNNLSKKMLDLVKEGRREPKEAAACLARFCSCGVFNPVRAERILNESRKGK
jgi:hypothetical protein